MSMVAVCLLNLATFGPNPRYARPELLVEPTQFQLTDNGLKIADKSVRLLDARGKGKYLEGHVAGAVWVDAITWARTFGEGEDRAGWEKRLGALGIDVSTPVVIYDDSLSKDAARIWWILRYWGVRDVRLVNGGWKACQSAKLKLEKTDEKPTPVTTRLEPAAPRLVKKSQLLDLVHGKSTTTIIDSRSTGEFCGTADTAQRNGAIPGAKHLEWSDLLDAKSGRFKSASELTQLFENAGIDVKKPAITYCQSGGRASVTAFALELLGADDVGNYYKSWSEWGNDKDTPIVKPEK